MGKLLESWVNFINIIDNGSFLTLYILMDFPIHTDTLSIGLPILHFKGSKLEFSVVFRSVNVCFNISQQWILSSLFA